MMKSKSKSGHLGRGVSIIGVGCTPLGDVKESEEILNCTEGELLAAATIEALDDAGIGSRDIDYVLLAQLAPNYTSSMANGSAMLAGWMGAKGLPSLSHDECCSSGNVGLANAAMLVASGVHDIVLCAGVGIGKSFSPIGVPRLPQFLEDNPYMAFATGWTDEVNYSNPGVVFFEPFDEAGVQYARKYGLTKENMWEAMTAAKAQVRENAVNNPLALLATETLDEEAQRMGFANAQEYYSSPMNPHLATLLRANDINSFLDGAAAVIVCPTEMAKKMVKKPIEVAGFGHASVWAQDYITIPFEPNRAAAQQAYSMAGITDPRHEVDWLSIHDCTILNYFRFTEDIGYFDEGEAYKMILEGEIAPNGKRPINTSGGRQGIGHPLAPSNLVEMYEAVIQMRGEAGDRQLNNAPKTCAIQSYCGGHAFATTILRA